LNVNELMKQGRKRTFQQLTLFELSMVRMLDQCHKKGSYLSCITLQLYGGRRTLKSSAVEVLWWRIPMFLQAAGMAVDLYSGSSL